MHAFDTSLDRSTRLIAAHEADAAYAELAPQENLRAGQPDFDYLLGLAALDSGHVTRAIFALQRVVAVRPDHHLARAELARAYLAAGEIDSARNEFEQVRRADLPRDAAAAIDRVLGVLDQVGGADRPTVTGYVEAGGGWDSNVNSATNAGQFAIPAFGGLLFNVAPGGGRTSDEFGTVAGGVTARLPVAKGWTWIGGVDARGNLNRTVHDMNTTVVVGSAGVSHVEGMHAQTVALQTNAAWVSSSLYRTANGASLQWQTQLDATSQMSLFGQWSRLAYSGQRERDADRSVLGVGYARNLASTGPLLYGSLYAAEERTRDGAFAHFGHRATALRLGVEQRLGTDTVGFAEAQLELRRYSGTEPLFDVQRKDRQTDLLVGMRFALAPQCQLVPQIRHTAAASNVVLYDYGRTALQLTFRKDFQ